MAHALAQAALTKAPEREFMTRTPNTSMVVEKFRVVLQYRVDLSVGLES